MQSRGRWNQAGVWPRWLKWCGLLGTVGLLLATGLWGSYECGHRTEERLRRDLIHEAIAIAAAIPIDEATALTFTAADRDLPEFQRISGQLKAYARTAGLRCLYTMSLRDGNLYFGPESLEPDHRLASPPGTLYEQPQPGDFKIFETAQPVIVGPNVDEYGPYYSAAAPVIHPDTGRVLLTVGLDVDPATWDARIHRARMIPLLIPLIGLLILCVCILLGRIRRYFPSSHMRHLHFIEAGACFSIMLVLTVGIAMLIHQMDTENRDEIFDSLAQLKATTYADEFLRIHDKLEMLPIFFKSSDYITREEFRIFSRNTIDSHSISACAWLPEIPQQELTALESGIRSADVPTYSIHSFNNGPPPDTDVHYPVLYIEPLPSFGPLLGLDFYSDPPIRSALMNCLRIDHPTASAPGSACLPEHQGNCFYVFQPVKAVAQRGVISTLIDPEQLLQRVAMRTSVDQSELSVALLETTENGGILPLACNRRDCPDADCWTLQTADLHRIAPIFAFGKTYLLLIAPEPAWYAIHPLRSQPIALTSGLLLTVLITGLIFVLANRPLLLEHTIRERTKDLIRSEERFEMAASAAGAGVWERNLITNDLIWDQRMYALYGLKPDEFINTFGAWKQCLHSEDLTRVLEEIDAACTTGDTLDTTFRVIRPNDEVRHIRAFGKVSYENGTATRMIGINLDISEVKGKEQEIFAQLEELNRWHSVTMGRETRIMQLKTEINGILSQRGDPPRYQEVLDPE